jgi:hypothetical protein
MQLLISPKLELRSPPGVHQRRRLHRAGIEWIIYLLGVRAVAQRRKMHPAQLNRAHISGQRREACAVCNVHYRRSIIGESAQPLKSTVLRERAACSSEA